MWRLQLGMKKAVAISHAPHSDIEDE